MDFRKKAIEYWEKGHTKEELYEVFGIYPSGITAWRKLLRETGSLKPQYKKTRNSKIDLKKLESELERKPDATLGGLAKIFDCTDSAIFCALKRAKLTLKKTFGYKEQCYIEVIFYIITLVLMLTIFRIKNIVYVDESGLNREYRRIYARAKRGVKVYDKKSGKRVKKVNIIAGLLYGISGKKHIAVHSYEHPTKSDFFEEWFEWQLLSEVPENSVIILDNASFHRKQTLIDIAARYGVTVVFLPPYSPQFNPIEQSWANFKRWLKYNAARFSMLEFAIDYYFVSRSIPLLI
jgi:transposase